MHVVRYKQSVFRTAGTVTLHYIWLYYLSLQCQAASSSCLPHLYLFQ